MTRRTYLLGLAVATIWGLPIAALQQAPSSGASPAPGAEAERQGGGREGGQAGRQGGQAGRQGGQTGRQGGAASFGTGENAELIFEEKWTRAPLTQPMTQENLGNQHLRLHLYGDIGGIRKTMHEIEDYTYTGETRNNWMITVSDPRNYFDLTLPGKVMLRTRNTGFRQTHIVIKTADGNYFVSEEGSGESRAWMNRDYILADLHWRSLTMVDTLNNARRPAAPDRAVIVAAGVATPDLGRVDEIGFTDLMPGGFIPATTRVNSWAVYGKTVPR
jgi:hypothetical protein